MRGGVEAEHGSGAPELAAGEPALECLRERPSRPEGVLDEASIPLVLLGRHARTDTALETEQARGHGRGRENALEASLPTSETSNHASQYTARAVAGQTAVCFRASSHCTMTSARLRPPVGSRSRCARIAPEPAKGRLATTANGSLGPTPGAGVDLEDGHAPLAEAPTARAQARVGLECDDTCACIGERTGEGAGPGADVDDEIVTRHRGLRDERGCEAATAKEVLAGGARRRSAPNGHGRPPSSSWCVIVR